MRTALIALDATVGDLDGNAALLRGGLARAAQEGAALAVFPELALCGYPPKDLLLRPGFIEACEEKTARLGEEVPEGLTAVIGAPRRREDGGVANSLFVFRGGRLLAHYDKRLLPTYDVFDEHRYFRPGDAPVVVEVAGRRVGLAVCEDLWKGEDAGFAARYRQGPDPVEDLVRAGAEIVVSPSASPFVLGKPEDHDRIMITHALRHGVVMASVNQHGGNDDLVFDGRCCAYDSEGRCLGASPAFGEAELIVALGGAVRAARGNAAAKPEDAGSGSPATGTSSVASADSSADAASNAGAAAPAASNAEPDSRASTPATGSAAADRAASAPSAAAITGTGGLAPARPPESLLFAALTLGVRDYLRKTGFERALIGLSGGIDSAVTAAVAVAALGRERVLGVGLPGKYSSEHSITDARELAERLGIAFELLPIAEPFEGYRGVLDACFERLGERRLGAQLPDLAEENLQARVRGTTLMALSNRIGAMLLTTGNKSELAVGYCTLYGDMNGGLAVLSDVSKIWVYRLARHLNAEFEACGFTSPPIPESTLSKPPSAELAPDQRDADSLPPYEVLDEIVERCVERRQCPEEIVRATGFEEDLVRRIVRLIAINEYKRKQAAIGLKVTSVAFGPGRRMPIAQGWFR